MRQSVIVAGLVAALLGGRALSLAEPAVQLPAGPIQDRHDLMEGIGKQAKIIGDAMKTANYTPVAAAAEKIQVSAGKALPLFPQGSTHKNSRAKPEIWTNWPKFEQNMKQMGTNAGALTATATNQGNVPEAAQTLFGSCKSCHDEFRVPDKKH